MPDTKIDSPPGTVTFSLNGRTLTVPVGTTILQAALQNGVYIPHYCYAPALSAPASCRLCLVEVEKMPKLAPACMMPVAEGMVVCSDSAKVEAARRDMMQFLLANHPLDCPVCDKGGECSLQDYAMRYGTPHSNFHDEKRRFKKPQFDPLLDIERNRCILCTRCVRFDAEICDNHKIVVLSRGNRNYIGTWHDEPIGSIFSGNNIDLCPVGCWTSKPFRFQARVWELTKVPGVCTYCSAGCGLVHWVRDGRVYRSTAAPPSPAERWNHDTVGHRYICDIGRFCSDYSDAPDRLARPMVRQGEELVETDWDDAVTRAVRQLKSVLHEHGPGSVGVLAGSRLSCEELAAVELFARRVLKTPHVDWRSGLVCDDGAAAHSAAFAMADGNLEAVEDYEAVLVVGGYLTETAPIVALRVKDAARRGKIKLYTLAARQDAWLSRSAAMALQVPAGQCGTLLKGLLYLLAQATNPTGALEPLVRRLVAAYPLERVATDCALRESDVRDFAQALFRIQRLLILHDPAEMGGLGACDTVAPIGYLKDLVNGLNPDQNAWHSLPVTAERNGLAAFLLGCQPDRTADGSVPAEIGLSAPAMLAAGAQGQLRALIVFHACDFAAHPQAKLLAQALSAIETRIVVDTFPSRVSAQADVVLPAASTLEQRCTFGDAFGRLLPMTPIGPAPGESLPIARIVQKLAERMGLELPSDSNGQLGATVAARLDPKGEGRMALHTGGKDAYRRLRISSAPVFSQGLALLWGHAHYGQDHDGSRSRVMPGLVPERSVYLHPRQAEQLGLQDGQAAELVVMGEVLPLPVALTPEVPPGAAFVYRNVVELPLGDPGQTYPAVEVRAVPNGRSTEQQ